MTRDSISRRRLLQFAGSTAAVGLAGCSSSDEEPTDAGTTTATTTTGMTTEAPSVSLSVSDTETENRTVTVPSASIDEDGWLVVHPEAPNGSGPLGAVTLATKQLSAGEHTDIELTLSSVTSGDQTVYAMLHYDDPADGEFSFPQNGDAAVTADGSPVVKPFTVTLTGEVTPSISVTDQETSGQTVTVPSAAIDQQGWLVVHPEADSGSGADGTTTYAELSMQPGLYGELTIPLTEQLSESQTLYAMLHYEDPADGEFTFPENGDPPVTTDGSPVVKPFEITIN